LGLRIIAIAVVCMCAYEFACAFAGTRPALAVQMAWLKVPCSLSQDSWAVRSFSAAGLA